MFIETELFQKGTSSFSEKQKPAATCSAINMAWVFKTNLFKKSRLQKKTPAAACPPYTVVGATNPHKNAIDIN